MIRTLTWVFAWFLFAAGLWTVLFTLGLISTAYTPVPFNDEWITLEQIAWGLTPSTLWAPHNEHRVALARLVTWADLQAFQGRMFLQPILIVLLQFGQALLFLWPARHWDPPRRLAALAIVLIGCFSPLQGENFLWPFQVAFLAAFVAAHGAIACAQRPTPIRAALAFFCIVISSLGLASGVAAGLLVLPLLLPHRRLAIPFAAAWILFAVLYFQGLQPLSGVSPLVNLMKPIELARYVTLLLANPFPSWLQHRPILLILLALALIAAACYRAFRDPSFPRTWPAFALFTLLNVILTGLGRLHFGLEQAQSARYQTPALLFWCAVALLALQFVRAGWHLPLFAACAILASAHLQNFESCRRGAAERQLALDRSALPLVAGALDPEELRGLAMGPDLIARLMPFLETRNYAPLHWRDQFGLGRPIGERFKPAVRPGLCHGQLETLKPLANGRVRLDGWTASPRTGQGLRWILFTDQQGIVLGVGRGRHYRPDLKFRVPATVEDTLGFVGYARARPRRAFASIPKDVEFTFEQACEIEVALPPPDGTLKQQQ
jgi:hypothetical protein